MRVYVHIIWNLHCYIIDWYNYTLLLYNHWPSALASAYLHRVDMRPCWLAELSSTSHSARPQLTRGSGRWLWPLQNCSIHQNRQNYVFAKCSPKGCYVRLLLRSVYFVYCGQHKCDLVTYEDSFPVFEISFNWSQWSVHNGSKVYPTDNCPLCCIHSLIVCAIHACI